MTDLPLSGQQARKYHDEATRDTLVAALSVARAAPAKQVPQTYAALIPWSLIHELRQALTDFGIADVTGGRKGEASG